MFPALFFFTLVATADPPPVDFVADVRPVFAKHCVSCHGPTKQKNGLRLDNRADALKGGDAGPAIRPRKATESLLYKLAAGIDEPAMPPGDAKLSAAELAILKRWIDAGAVWPAAADAPKADPLDWWSFRPVARPPLPATGDRNPIDAFIHAKLAEKGMTPAPRADRSTLIRRVYFDLIGLPPTADEIRAFELDLSPDAYEKLVAKLLASPRYGERWARHWLDVAHYGDTHGYDKDQPRPNAWPYRDYVIRSLNADVQYDRFVREQLAGDVFAPGTAAGIEALGFLSAGPWDLIGHAEIPETKTDGKIARHLDRDDMVATVSQTFLSLTAQCAQCHDHKFDPVSSEDYYSLQAVFAAIDRADRTYDRDPATASKRAAVLAKKAVAEAIIKTIEAAAGPRFTELKAKIRDATGPGKRPPEHGYHSAISATAEAAKWVQIDLGKLTAIATVAMIACFDDFNGIGAGFGFPVRFKIETADDPAFKLGVRMVMDRTTADVPNPGLAAMTFPAVGTARYVRITATKLAPRLNDSIFALSELEVRDAAGVNFAAGATVTALDTIEAPVRWAKSNLTDGKYPTTAGGAAALNAELATLMLKTITPENAAKLAAATAEVRAVDREYAALPPPATVYCGTVHSGGGAFSGTGGNGGKPRPIFVLPRGDVTRPGKPVEPGAVAKFPFAPGRFTIPTGLPESARRAALAEWITHPQNPLTHRSIVNRVWRYHFGRGLVETPNDFGRMGQLPSHPELLDWLAAEFVRTGQSWKWLHNLIVTSETYRQSAAVNQYASVDAENRYYWRANRRKLDAETVRDSMLAAAGKLNPAMYGPAFRDFLVERPEHSPHYEYEKADPDDPATHRRSIYRFIVRSRTQPFLTALDCADPSMQVEKRNESVSASQALAMLNNAFVLTMAKHLAARVEPLVADAPGRVTAAVRFALGRDPSPAERDALSAYARDHGLKNLCRLLFNLNEFAFAD